MPVRLAIFGDSPCHLCTAACCRQTVHAYAVLLQSADEQRRFRPWSVTAAFRDRHTDAVTTEHVIPYVNGKCPFLAEDNRCRIYDDRPLACRQFQCVSRFNASGFGRHDPFLYHNPQVLRLLESL